MRYWVFINEQVSQEPYEADSLYAIQGFTDETLIMPEDSSQQDWQPAYNFADVQQARPQQGDGDTEMYHEVTDRSAIPTHYQDISEDATSTQKKDMETTLLLKLDDLTGSPPP